MRNNHLPKLELAIWQTTRLTPSEIQRLLAAYRTYGNQVHSEAVEFITGGRGLPYLVAEARKSRNFYREMHRADRLNAIARLEEATK